MHVHSANIAWILHQVLYAVPAYATFGTGPEAQD